MSDERQELRELYESMRDRDLEDLRDALSLDRDDARIEGRKHAVGFCNGRLALIREILNEREEQSLAQLWRAAAYERAREGEALSGQNHTNFVSAFVDGCMFERRRSRKVGGE